MAKKLALLIGNDHYQDSSLGNLLAPQDDVGALKTVLEGAAYGFKVETLFNPEVVVARQKVFDLFDDRDHDDTLLFYFSGHGVLGNGRSRQLFLALQQTDYDRPGRDSLSAADIKNSMDNSYARRQIILLDCCHSGAFSAADKGGEALTEESFSLSGKGKALLASSTRMQSSQDGSKTGLQHSLFTHHLVAGLKGKAANEAGMVTLERLYRHVYRQVKQDRGDMTPVKWIGDQEGEFELGYVNPNGGLSEDGQESSGVSSGIEIKTFPWVTAVVMALLLGGGGYWGMGVFSKLEAEKDRLQQEVAQRQAEEVELHRQNAEDKRVSQALKKAELQSKIQGLLAQGEKALGKNRLSRPKGDNAKLYFEQVLALEPENIVATEGLRKVVERYGSLFDQALVGGDLRRADKLIGRLQVLPVPAAELEKLKQRLSERKAVRVSGSVFQDRLKNGGKAPKMVVIPAGSFRMGCVSGQSCKNTEKPVHRVTIAKNFALGQTEVTVGQFRRFVNATGYKTRAEGGQGCYGSKAGQNGYRKGLSWRNPGFEQSDLHPMVCVSWNDTKAYAKWLSEQTGESYRLPTEAEWEYAVRAGSKSEYYFGDQESDLCRYANVADQTAKQKVNFNFTVNCSDGFVYTAPVSRFKANAFGLQDMHGNAWEWTEDCWHGGYTDAPNDGRAWFEGAGAECRRVIRGGSWINNAVDMRSANRIRSPTDGTYINIGFRLARALF